MKPGFTDLLDRSGRPSGAVLASEKSVAEADRLSLESLELAPAVPHVLGTRGAVLVVRQLQTDGYSLAKWNAGGVGESSRIAQSTQTRRLASLPFSGAPTRHLGFVEPLVRLGRFEEGVSYCDQAIAKRIDPRSKAHHHCWIAIAAARLGDPNRARASLAAARKLGAECPDIERLAAEAEALLETPPPAQNRA